MLTGAAVVMVMAFVAYMGGIALVHGIETGEHQGKDSGLVDGFAADTGYLSPHRSAPPVHSRLRRLRSGAGANSESVEDGSYQVPSEFGTVIPAGIMFGVFRKEDGPFLIEGSITVPVGQVLEFGPGSQVFIGGNYTTITVFGQMLARGTAREPIVFQSASPTPNPWDWDRIYCRSRTRSEFSHCSIRHSNYGLFVENGMVHVDNCTFEFNSLHGLFVRNATVSVASSRFRGGHVLALYLDEGAMVSAREVSVTDNLSGVACADHSSLDMSGGEISSNTNGIAVEGRAAVVIVATAITRNRTGLLAPDDIARRNREMVYGNAVDFRSVTAQVMDHLLTEPQEVTSVVLPEGRSRSVPGADFAPGFSASSEPRHTQSSLIGNITAGLNYYRTVSYNPPQYDTTWSDDGTDPARIDTVGVRQTRYPGEGGGTPLEGLEPTLQLFMSGRRGGGDVNLLADVYGNQWTGFRTNMFNLSLDYAHQQLIIGDFFESGNETSISGRKMTGLKMQGSALDMGRGERRVAFTLAAGETAFPKDSGDREIDLYNEVVDSAMSVRQQLTYLASLSVKPTLHTNVFMKGIIARDQQDNPFLRHVLTDPAAPDPIQAQSGAIGAEVTLLEGMVNLGAEINLGGHDTLGTEDDIDWYNPRVGESVGKVFGDFGDIRHFAGTLNAEAFVSGTDINARFTGIGPAYFSAGNPYLEKDRRVVALDARRTLFREVVGKGGYEWYQSSASSRFDLEDNSNGPQSSHTLFLSAERDAREGRPGGSLDWSAAMVSQKRTDRRSDSVLTINRVTGDSSMAFVSQPVGYMNREMRNQFALGYRHLFGSAMDLTLRYHTAITTDVSDYSRIDKPLDQGQVQHLVTARHSLRLGRVVTNRANLRLALKTKSDDTFFGYSWKISDQIRVVLIPRRLTMNLRGEYGIRRDTEESTGTSETVTLENDTWGIDGDVRVTLTSKVSVTVLGKYEYSRDAAALSTDNYKVSMGGMNLTYLF